MSENEYVRQVLADESGVKWDPIFKNPMTAAAAIDRLVHHAVILELNRPSYRVEKAMEKERGPAATEAGQP